MYSCSLLFFEFQMGLPTRDFVGIRVQNCTEIPTGVTVQNIFYIKSDVENVPGFFIFKWDSLRKIL